MHVAILAHGDWSGIIFIAFLAACGIVLGYGLVIVAAFWISSRLGGSTALVWGALLGVSIGPILAIVFRGTSLGWYLVDSLLQNAAASAVVACLVNAVIWLRKHWRNSPVEEGRRDTD
jgi:hypothetical protein